MYICYAICFWCIVIPIGASTDHHVISSGALTKKTAMQTTEQDTDDVHTEVSNSPTNDYGYFKKEFLECPKITLYSGEYVLLSNLSIYIPTYANLYNDSLLELGRYYINDFNESFSVAYICPPRFIIPHEAERERQSIGPLSYITFVCLSISLLSLFLHFIAFLILPEMRNLPGKNLASLTFSLFLSYLLYLLGIIFDKTPVCHPLGIFIYYFMMVSFFWMNAISFDIFKSVRAATAKLRITVKSEELKQFVCYSLYSWLAPALIVATSVIAEETTIFPQFLKPLFKNKRCWFTQRLAIIVFFASPAAILMLANIFFFIASAVIISSNSMKANKHKSNLKRNVLLYLKLIVITGLLWTTGIVSAIINEKVIMYVTLPLSTLQGLYIFIAFTRFKKIVDRVKHRDAETTLHNRSGFTSSVSRVNTSKTMPFSKQK